MMPPTSQLLYIHLSMNADDDGFCEHFPIMRMVEAKPDDLKVLSAKDFVQVFDDKVLIISEWKENNYLRSDRYTPSKYLEVYKNELAQISSGIPVVDQMATQVRLGKDRLVKNKEVKTVAPLPSWLRKDVWDQWLKYRSERKKPVTPTMAEKQWAFLNRYKKWHVDILESAIRNGWLGLYPPKGKEGERFEQEPLPEMKGFIDNISKKFVITE